MATIVNLDASTVNTLNAVVWVAASFAVVIVFARLYVRFFLKRVFGADDVAVVIATILLVVYAAICSAAASFGLGRHLEYVAQNPDHLMKVALLADIGEVFAILACTLSKTSFAITLLRIVVQPKLKALLWFIIITMNTVNVLTTIFVFAQCKDPRHLWNPVIPSQCWPTDVFTNFSLFVGAYSGAQDFILALLPWTIVWNLQMEKKDKFGVAIAMSLGVFAGVAAIVKTTFLVELSAKSDFTWALAPLLLYMVSWWAAVEDGLAIVAASIPTLRPLFRKALGIPDFKVGFDLDTRSYVLNSVSNSENVHNLRPGELTRPTVDIRPGSVPSDGDDHSDRSIFSQQVNDANQRYSSSYPAMESQQNIKRTDEVHITYT